jgi:hypothetical protein
MPYDLEEELHLIRQYRISGDKASLERITMAHFGLIVSRASRSTDGMDGSGNAIEDGIMDVVRAVETYDLTAPNPKPIRMLAGL